MKEENTVKKETQKKGIMIPAGTVGIFSIVAWILCIDFIDQAVQLYQTDASAWVITRKSLAAAGWGLITISLAAKLWENYKNSKKKTL